MPGRDDPFVRADSKPPSRLLRALRRHAWWMFLLAVAACLLVAREAGLVDLERTTFSPRLLASIPSRTAEAAAWKEGEAYTPHPYVLEIDARGDEGLRDGLFEALKDLKGLEPAKYGGTLKLTVEKAEYAGRYWMPIKKEGKASFRLHASGRLANAKKRLDYDADFEATVDFIADGPCSLRGLKKRLGDLLGGAVNDDVSAQMLRGE